MTNGNGVIELSRSYLKKTDAKKEGLLLGEFDVYSTPLAKNLLEIEKIDGRKPSDADIESILSNYKSKINNIDHEMSKKLLRGYTFDGVRLPKYNVVRDFKQRVNRRFRGVSKTQLNDLLRLYKSAFKKYSKNLPLSFQHCDLHKENIIIDKNGEVKILDFEKASVGPKGVLDLPYLLEDPSFKLSEEKKRKYLDDFISDYSPTIRYSFKKAYELYSTHALLAYLAKLKSYETERARSMVSVLENKALSLEKSEDIRSREYGKQLNDFLKDNFKQ